MNVFRAVPPIARLAGFTACIALATPHGANAQINYTVLGDSYAYGYTTPAGTGSGNGAPSGGYFQGFANALGAQQSKTVTVTNVAILGETTASFAAGPLPSPNANTTYAGSAATSQAAEAQLKLSAATNVVTLQLGGNDGINYLYQSIYGTQTTPNTTTSSPVLVQAANNVGTILQSIHAAAPNATVFLIGYADAFAALNPALNPNANGLQGFDVQATQSLNSLLAAKAQANNARFVDIAPLFSTNSGAQNYLGNFFNINVASANTNFSGLVIPDFHPNAAGYNAISQALVSAASAPEPGSFGLMASVTLLFGGILRRRVRA